MKKYVLIVAGGKGLRMGGDLPKQFMPVEGKPLLMHTLETFYRWDPSVEIVLVLPADHQPYWQMLCREIGCDVPHQIATGGETRFHSVRNGLAFLSAAHGWSATVREDEALIGPEEEALLEQTEEVAAVPAAAENIPDNIVEKVVEKPKTSSDKPATACVEPSAFYIAVHDGVRPFVAPGVITACFDEAIRHGAAVPVLPMIDSLRESSADGSRPVDRSRYFAVQTPQVFDGRLLLDAYDRPYAPSFTDDASVVEALGLPVHMVEGNRENIKITTPFDLLVAEALFRRSASESFTSH